MQASPALLSLLALACSPKDDALSAPAMLSDTATPHSEPGLPDEGCIHINGAGGFSSIGDALDWAEDGDVITLCSGEYNERVIIDKSVTLKGPTSGEPAVIRVTDDTSAISVRADNVNLSWMTVHSGGLGVFLADVDNIALQVMSFGDLGDTAIHAQGSTNVLLQASNFEALPMGVFHLDEGGSARVINCNFESIAGYATRVRNGATLSIEGNEFYGNMADEEARNAAVRATDGAILYTSNNLFSANTAIAISGTDAHIQSTSDTFDGGTHAIATRGGSLTLALAAISNPTVTGVKASSASGDISISDTTISADPSTNTLGEAEIWDPAKAHEGAGIYISSARAVSIESVDISGFNHGGLVVTASGLEPILVDFRDIEIEATGWQGIYAKQVDAHLTNVNISNVRTVTDISDGQCSTVGNNAAATFFDSTVDWLGGSLSNNDGVGFCAMDSDSQISGIAVSGSTCAGVMNFGGTLAIDDSDFSAPSTQGLAASVVNYNATNSTLSNSRFVDSGTIGAYAETGTEDFSYIYYDMLGSDFQAWFGGEHTVTGNTFSGGAQGVYGHDATLFVSANSWTDYAQYGVLISGGEATLSDNRFEDGSGHAIACIQATMNVSDHIINNTLVSSHRSSELYISGELIGTYPEITAYPAMFLEGCDTAMSGLTVTDTAAMAGRVLGGNHTFSDISILRTSTAASFATSNGLDFTDTWSRDGLVVMEPVIVDLTDFSLSETNFGAGISFAATTWEDGSRPSNLNANNLDISNTGALGLEIANAEATFTNLDISDTTSASLSTVSSTVSIVDGALSNGILSIESALSLADTSLQNGSSDGLAATGGSVSMTGCTIKQNSENGLNLAGVVATLSENDITDNGGYGIVCGSSTFTLCDNIFGGNLLGPTDTCDAICGLSETEDEGVEDTGL
jgi:hypothetical protein